MVLPGMHLEETGEHIKNTIEESESVRLSQIMRSLFDWDVVWVFGDWLSI